jgi:hypothetical protein
MALAVNSILLSGALAQDARPVFQDPAQPLDKLFEQCPFRRRQVGSVIDHLKHRSFSRHASICLYPFSLFPLW